MILQRTLWKRNMLVLVVDAVAVCIAKTLIQHAMMGFFYKEVNRKSANVPHLNF